jgi:hypothetical protein
VEDRVLQFEDKIEIKEKRRTLTQKTQELWQDYARTQWLHLKRLNLRIMGTEEGEEVQAKGQ